MGKLDWRAMMMTIMMTIMMTFVAMMMMTIDGIPRKTWGSWIG